jgi:hypothetical protein
LQTPPAVRINASAYENKTNTWNADIHLISTYCFLSKEEAQLFAAEDQVYLVKDVFEYSFPNVTGSSKVKLTSNGMISNWMFYFQRDDVNLRNEWSNYTNWPYRTLPADILAAPIDLPYNFNSATDPNRLISDYLLTRGPLVNPTTNMNTGYYITGAYSVDNRKDILETLGIVLDGDYRENVMTRGIYDYIEKYTRTNGAATDGLYCYNFCLNTNPLDYQPSGAINLSRFKSVELEFTTYAPQFDLEGSNVNIVCDDTGIPIGISSKPSWRLYQYNFNMTLFEERYNILSFIGGNCGMLYAR